jgi:flagellar hook assembly protein FlgD
LPEGAPVQVALKVYDIRGRFVRTLMDEAREPGAYTVFWNGTNEGGRQVSSGVYFYRMQAGDFVQIRKMVLLK